MPFNLTFIINQICSFLLIIVLVIVSLGLYLQLVEMSKVVVVTTKWNIEDLKNNLSVKMYGQDEAMSQLLTAVNESQYRTNEQYYVVLLGGPGVGKTYVSEILEDHVECIENVDKVNEETDWNKIPNLFEEVKSNKFKYKHYCYYVYDLENYVYKADCESWNYLIKKTSRPYLRRRTYFNTFILVIPTILEIEDVEKFSTSQEYNEYLDQYERDLKSHLSHLDFQVIKFKPMNSYHVRWCAEDQDKDYLFMFHDRSDKDFVDNGCKM